MNEYVRYRTSRRYSPARTSDNVSLFVQSKRMPSQNKNDDDRRVKRTKSLVFDAFFEMVQTSRYDELKTKDIIAKADIGRSTFYEHFLDKDDLLSQSLEYPMSIFAAALTGNDNYKDLLFMLTHFWERRVFARVILRHPTRDVVDSCLRELILSNMRSVHRSNEADLHAHACFLTSGFLNLLNEWLVGRLSITAEGMSKYIRVYSSKR